MIWAAGAIVVASAFFLLTLAVAIWAVPKRAESFLRAFASSARTHYTEQLLRLGAGLGFILFAAEMRFSDLFRVFGWVLVVSAGVLLLMPWQWHQRFGEWAIPLAIRHLKLYGLGALGLAAFILYSLF